MMVVISLRIDKCLKCVFCFEGQAALLKDRFIKMYSFHSAYK